MQELTKAEQLKAAMDILTQEEGLRERFNRQASITQDFADIYRQATLHIYMSLAKETGLHLSISVEVSLEICPDQISNRAVTEVKPLDKETEDNLNEINILRTLKLLME